MKPWKPPFITRSDDFLNPRPPIDSADEAKKETATGIEHFVSAVANGNFEEDLFYVGGRLVGAKSVIHFSDRNIPITWSRFGIDLFRKKTKRHIDYEPYL
jgi:hypothetical protein